MLPSVALAVPDLALHPEHDLVRVANLVAVLNLDGRLVPAHRDVENLLTDKPDLLDVRLMGRKRERPDRLLLQGAVVGHMLEALQRVEAQSFPAPVREQQFQLDIPDG